MKNNKGINKSNNPESATWSALKGAGSGLWAVGSSILTLGSHIVSIPSAMIKDAVNSTNESRRPRVSQTKNKGPYDVIKVETISNQPQDIEKREITKDFDINTLIKNNCINLSNASQFKDLKGFFRLLCKQKTIPVLIAQHIDDIKLLDHFPHTPNIPELRLGDQFDILDINELNKMMIAKDDDDLQLPKTFKNINKLTFSKLSTNDILLGISLDFEKNKQGNRIKIE